MPPAQVHRFADDGCIPNNPKLPLVVYVGVLPDSETRAADFEARFAANGWTNSWRNGVFDFHHFHSNTHEVLGVAAGEARLQFGGADGVLLTLRAGDVAVLPAGTGHRRDWASSDFLVVGAYPDGRDFDICRGEPADHDRVRGRIALVPLPKHDPIAGGDGVTGWDNAKPAAFR